MNPISTIKDNQMLTAHSNHSGHNVEFFHIYTDELISDGHNSSIEYLKSLTGGWEFDFSTIILIDNYNPKEHVLEIDELFIHLESRDVLPHYWAYEADMVDNAETLLSMLPDNKLKRRYLRYISDHDKYPCSLLTATWYLTRLGQLDTTPIRCTSSEGSYRPAKRLINILPAGYKSVEMRARGIIKISPFKDSLDGIQDLFIPTEAKKMSDIF